jgi:hypothetical protein
MMTHGKHLKKELKKVKSSKREPSLNNKLHFKGIDWVIYFPSTGNEGRQIISYGVSYRDRVNKTTQQGPKINLKNVFEKLSTKENYPHEVGLFLNASGRRATWTPA